MYILRSIYMYILLQLLRTTRASSYAVHLLVFTLGCFHICRYAKAFVTPCNKTDFKTALECGTLQGHSPGRELRQGLHFVFPGAPDVRLELLTPPNNQRQEVL